MAPSPTITHGATPSSILNFGSPSAFSPTGSPALSSAINTLSLGATPSSVDLNFFDSSFDGDPDPIGTLFRRQEVASNLAKFNQRVERGEASLGRPQNQSNSFDPLLSFGVQAGAGFVPVVGEIQDAAVLFGSDSTVGERFLAGGSLLLNVVTLGFGPNAGGVIRGSDSLIGKPPLANNQAFRDNFDEVFGTTKVKTNQHHSDPKFIGGDLKQKTTTVTEPGHIQLHKDLNDHLRTKSDEVGNHMRPQRGNSGAKIRDNFSRQELLEATAEFYKKNRDNYPASARDFFGMHPGLK